MRIFILIFVLLANIVLQTTFFSYINIIGISPNTSLLLIVTYAMLRGDVEGAIFGFFTGLVQDIVFGRVIGLYAMLGLVTGYFCGKPFKDFYRENYMTPLFLVGIASTAYSFSFYILYFLFQGKIDLFFYTVKIILPETVYTILMTIPFYRLMYGINSRLETHERYTRKLF